jgi:energy-converting hydrogenase B subunit D
VNAIQAVVLVCVAAGGTAVVFSREPLRQAMVVGIYGLLLAVLFFVFQAPDVSLSQVVVSTVAIPVMIMLALAKVNEQQREHESEGDE